MKVRSSEEGILELELINEEELKRLEGGKEVEGTAGEYAVILRPNKESKSHPYSFEYDLNRNIIVIGKSQIETLKENKLVRMGNFLVRYKEQQDS